MWIPSHIGIEGNSLADEAAKYATNAPILSYSSSNKSDIIRIIFSATRAKEATIWSNYHHLYKTFNPQGSVAVYPNEISKLDLRKYTRIRLGHTLITHQHLFENTSPNICNLCNSNQMFDINHLIFNCNFINNTQIALYGKICLPELLKNINTENV